MAVVAVVAVAAVAVVAAVFRGRRGRGRRGRGRDCRRWLPRCGPCRARGVVVAGAAPCGRDFRRWLWRWLRLRWQRLCRPPCCRGAVAGHRLWRPPCRGVVFRPPLLPGAAVSPPLLLRLIWRRLWKLEGTSRVPSQGVTEGTGMDTSVDISGPSTLAYCARSPMQERCVRLSGQDLHLLICL